MNLIVDLIYLIIKDYILNTYQKFSGISNQTAHTASIVSNNPIWNHSFEFKGASKKENILFIIRDADQILGSLQVSFDLILNILENCAI